MPNVFISYIRQNSEIVDRLAGELRRHGVTVWLDREEIMPGADWQYAIRQATKAGDYFIACFSAEYVARPITYMNSEIGLAVEMLQQMPPQVTAGSFQCCNRSVRSLIAPLTEGRRSGTCSGSRSTKIGIEPSDALNRQSQNIGE